MKLAVLFWCYKNLPICLDRLRHLRHQNPDAPIYVLFGGEMVDATEWERATAPFVDDFYAFGDEPPPAPIDIDEYRGGKYWKYLHGDLMFGAWYRDRGHALEWDTVVVVQWDMLIFGPLPEVFSCLKKDQILFSGLRPVKEVEDHWVWVADTGTQARKTYVAFIDYLKQRYGYDQDPLCCLAIVLCLPRVFLEKFAQIEEPWQGGLEYRMPMYAQVFGIDFCTDHPFAPWWAAVEKPRLTHTLRARPVEIWTPVIAANLGRGDGARVFHPYWHKVPRGILGWIGALVASVPRAIGTALARSGFRGLRGAGS